MAKMEFVGFTKDQMGHLYKAENQLSKAGVHFDTGYDFGTKTRVWELDWSLKGAKITVNKEEELGKVNEEVI